MPSQGPTPPNGVSQTNLGQINRLAWDDPVRVLVDDGFVAQCARSSATYRLTYKLIGDTFQFSIPAGQIIAGFEFTFNCATNLTLGGQCRDGTAELMVNGEVVGQILSSNTDWTAGTHDRTIGGPANLWGWTSATPELVNDTTFSVRFDIQVASGNTASVDWIEMKVYYTAVNTDSFVGSHGIGVGGTGSTWRYAIGQGSTGGGVGVGGTGKRFVGYGGTIGAGGAGAGGTGGFIRRNAFIGTHGLGLGGTFIAGPWLAAYGGTHGIGVAGDGLFSGSIFTEGTAAIGLGGDAGYLYAEGGTGGMGLGGTAEIYRLAAFEGTSGVGAGGTGLWIRRPGIYSEGGIGLFGEGTNWVRVAGVNGTFGGGRISGLGLSGSGRPRGMRADETINPEDDIERSHRGPVTRRMVFEAIRQALIDGPLNAYRVYISEDEPDMTNVPAGQTFAVIIPSSASNDQGDTMGGGDIGTLRTDGLEVRVYSHSSIDPAPKSSAWALKIDTGAMERTRKIRRTLHLLDLIDGGGWALLAEPMRATTTGKAVFRRVNPQWGYYGEVFEVKFTEYLG